MGGIVTLTTDFGISDGYVGALKGALLSVAPDVTIIDIAHDLPRHDRLAAAYVLRSACPHFPSQTVHLCVVDPGVGGDRRGIVAQGERHLYVGPDNGVFTLAFELDGPPRIHQIAARHYVASQVSPTFHGRDVFAPVAARLSQGADRKNIGPAIQDPVRLELARPRLSEDGRIFVQVVYVDRFGNAVTNLTRRGLATAYRRTGRTSCVLATPDGAEGPIRTTFEGAPPDSPFLIVNSSDWIEVVCNRGSASELLSLVPGSHLTLELRG